MSLQQALYLRSLQEMESKCQEYSKGYYWWAKFWRGLHYTFSTVPFIGPIIVGVINIKFNDFSTEAGIASLVVGGVSGMVTAFKANEHAQKMEEAGDAFKSLAMDVQYHSVEYRNGGQDDRLGEFFTQMKELIGRFDDPGIKVRPFNWISAGIANLSSLNLPGANVDENGIIRVIQDEFSGNVGQNESDSDEARAWDLEDVRQRENLTTSHDIV